MSYPAALVANEMLRLGREEGINISPMKLQKLVYLAHGWHLAFLDKPLISDTIEAWPYGPVIPSLYQEFKQFRAAPITRDATVRKSDSELSAESKDLIKSVWDAYKKDTAVALSALTHEAGNAWDIARHSEEESAQWGSPEILDQLISEEFKRRIKS